MMLKLSLLLAVAAVLVVFRIVVIPLTPAHTVLWAGVAVAFVVLCLVMAASSAALAIGNSKR
jgi:uncharacterized protein YqgC (DUF456 family)